MNKNPLFSIYSNFVGYHSNKIDLKRRFSNTLLRVVKNRSAIIAARKRVQLLNTDRLPPNDALPLVPGPPTAPTPPPPPLVGGLESPLPKAVLRSTLSVLRLAAVAPAPLVASRPLVDPLFKLLLLKYIYCLKAISADINKYLITI